MCKIDFYNIKRMILKNLIDFVKFGKILAMFISKISLKCDKMAKFDDKN